MSDTHLILHVKGTEGTTTLPKQVVRAAISQGQITHSQLIWSPEDNAWKQVRELPHLLPSQKMAPAPLPRVGTGTLPHATAVPQSQPGTIPRVAAGPMGAPQAKAVAASPKARIATARTPQVKVASVSPKARVMPAGGHNLNRSFEEREIKEEHGAHPFKWLCIGLGIVILIALGINYLLVDEPLVSNLGQTSYSRVTVFAHLGAFMQPNVLVIHIPVSSDVTAENLPAFLVALAKSTPEAPFSHSLFTRVALTTGWTGQYSFSGLGWQQLGEMGRDTTAHQKEVLLEEIGNASGESLMGGNETLNDEALQAKSDQVWNKLAAYFTHS